MLIGLLAWPIVLTNSVFNDDWLNHLWYMWHESLAIRANHWPSLFLNYSHAVFYPYYAFYSGTIYALTGTLSLALGNAPIETYILTYLMAFGAAYGGWYWIARMAGLGDWRAQAPGLSFITSSYYLTLIYARGDWSELLGVSMIPLMIAAGLSVLRADRLRIWPAVALAGSSIVFFGSHDITVLWGSTILGLTGLAILICVPRARREITGAGVLRVVGLVALGLLVNAWFLLPTLVYESQTLIGSGYANARRLLLLTMPLVSSSHLFTLSRASASAGVGFALSLPVLVIAWVLAGIAILLPAARGGAWMRVLLIISAVTVLTVILMTHVELLLDLPKIYTQVQFGYRLESYVLLGISGAVLIALVLAQGGSPRVRLWAWALLPVLIVSVVGAVQQTAAYPRSDQRGTALASYLKPPPTVEGLSNYLDIDLPQLAASRRSARIQFPPAAVHGDHVSVVVHLRPERLYYTNIAGSPDLVHITGAHIVGIGPEGHDVIRLDSAPGVLAGTDRMRTAGVGTGRMRTAGVGTGRMRTAGAGTGRMGTAGVGTDRMRGAGTDPAPRSEAGSGASTRPATQAGRSRWTETISVATADSFPVVLGRLLSVSASVVLAAGFVVLAVRGRRAGAV